MKSGTDVQLHQDVIGELEAGPRLDTSRVAVAVRNGVVTLSGSVPSSAVKSATEKAVRRLCGVLGVMGDLTVQPPPELHTDRNIADRNIAEAARWALEWAVITPGYDIQVSVENGWLTLEGEVERQEQRHDAHDAVRRLRGVQGVINLLTLTLQSACQGIDASTEAASWHSAAQEAGKAISGGEVSSG
ncbi:BON domain-containing protein [Deinococcus sp.]|uniref:BON domain-containing protein n=1 Tax=Deinococcus sp. TaxID=47478 RepID=UPI00286E5B4C|nr:BON domain-containing protein [Deinococcus sp.]